MIKQLSENKRLRKITLTASAIVMSASLMVTTTSFTDWDSWDNDLLTEDDGSYYYAEVTGGGSGSCWKTVTVLCGSVTTVTETTATGAGASIGATITMDQNGNILPGISGTNLLSFFRRKKKQRNTTSQTVTKYRVDCASDGTMGCQPTNCEGASVGSYLPCSGS